MIQVLTLRPPHGTRLLKDVAPSSVADLFANLDEYLAAIPEPERWNAYFTPAHCGTVERKHRRFESTDLLWWDFDHIDVERLEEYIELFCSTLKVKREDIGIVFSGRGLHFYILLATPIVDPQFFKTHKADYEAVLLKLERACQQAGLPYDLDRKVFEGARMMRLPGTMNHKPERGADVQSRLIQGNIKAVPFDLAEAGGLPKAQKEEAAEARAWANTSVDSKAIMTGCRFLAEAWRNPAGLSEPQWYAALSITARMGREYSHEISRGHPGYDARQTDQKHDQALTRSAPRKCETINTEWGGCPQCPNFQRITSPIQLKSATFISTEASGFYNLDKHGQPNLSNPNYPDLIRAFEREQTVGAAGDIFWRWTGKHWEDFDEQLVKVWAYNKLSPRPKSFQADEFALQLSLAKNFDLAKLTPNAQGYVNFGNGVLNLATMQLEPHRQELGFRSTLPYDYDPAATAPAFEKFLDEVTCGEEILKETLLEFSGYALADVDSNHHKALLLDGGGANGKSTFMDTLRAVVGTGCTSLSLREMLTPDRRARLDGALLNITEEAPRGNFDTLEFKNITGGGVITVKQLYKNPYAIKCRVKLLMACNELPHVRDASAGFFRRFLIVPFNQTFSHAKGNIDLGLKKKLATELPGIFNLMIAAYHRLVKKGYFAKESKPDEDIEAYARQVDPLTDWANEKITYHEMPSEVYVTYDQLFKSYLLYAEEYHGRFATILNIAQFQKRVPHLIKDFDLRAGKAYPNGRKHKQARVVRGISAEVGSGEV